MTKQILFSFLSISSAKCKDLITSHSNWFYFFMKMTYLNFRFTNFRFKNFRFSFTNFRCERTEETRLSIQIIKNV